MTLVLLLGGSGDKLVAERLTPAAQMPYEAVFMMRLWEKPSQPREEGTRIDGCRSRGGGHQSLGGDRHGPLTFIHFGLVPLI